jgi:hypothetical protein
MQFLHYDPRSTPSMGCQNVILVWQFKHAHYTWVIKCNTHIITLNPRDLWEDEIQNPYVKQFFFLMEFDDHVKSIQRN